MRIVLTLVVFVACGAPAEKPTSLPLRKTPNVGTTAQVSGCDNEPPADHVVGLAETGAIQGVVTDLKTCDALVGVTVIVTSPALTQPTNTITDEHGAYKINDLSPGDYLVTFYYKDFTATRSGVHVGIGKSTPVFQSINQAAAVGEQIHSDATAPTVRSLNP